MWLAIWLAGQQDAGGSAELYDGQGKKIITYPRAEVRYLPQSLISDVPQSWPDCGWANRSAQSPYPSRR